MRTFSSTVQNLISQDTVDFFFLIDLEFSTTYRLSSLPYDVIFDGNTYTANGAILEVDSPKFSSVVDRESYRVVVVEDDNDTFKSEIDQNVVGKDITVRVGFFDSSGDPVLTTGDVLLVYKGYVDSPAISNNFDNKLVTFEGTSPMSDLDMVIPFIGSKNGIKQKDEDDESFSNIYGESVIKLKWGKV
jgi:hypothetical protein